MLPTKSNLIAERLRIHDTDTVAYILGGIVVASVLKWVMISHTQRGAAHGD